MDRVVELADAAFKDGDFRWAATLLDHAIFADADHAGARKLYADTLEQLAYGAENATWRNFFLSGATELRTGNFGTVGQVTSMALISQLSPEQLFESLAIRINGPRAWDLALALDVSFVDTGVNYRLTLRNGVLVHRKVPADPGSADVTVMAPTKLALLAALLGDGGLDVSGDQTAWANLLGVLDNPDPNFNIVTP